MSMEGLPANSRATGILDKSKARRAAKHPGRPGEQCLAPGGRYAPKIDRGRCEGKADCVVVCPYNVFEVRSIEKAEYRALSLIARIKLWTHGKQTAYTPRADACRACGLCVVACPENAITLVQIGGTGLIGAI